LLRLASDGSLVTPPTSQHQGTGKPQQQQYEEKDTGACASAVVRATATVGLWACLHGSEQARAAAKAQLGDYRRRSLALAGVEVQALALSTRSPETSSSPSSGVSRADALYRRSAAVVESMLFD
jgi:hypothetical protein